MSDNTVVVVALLVLGAIGVSGMLVMWAIVRAYR